MGQFEFQGTHKNRRGERSSQMGDRRRMLTKTGNKKVRSRVFPKWKIHNRVGEAETRFNYRVCTGGYSDIVVQEKEATLAQQLKEIRDRRRMEKQKFEEVKSSPLVVGKRMANEIFEVKSCVGLNEKEEILKLGEWIGIKIDSPEQMEVVEEVIKQSEERSKEQEQFSHRLIRKKKGLRNQILSQGN